jgi:hypothetical protein
VKIAEERGRFIATVHLDWATEITETTFFREINKLPAAKTHFMIRREGR